jgi:hypothetical protein
VSARRWIVLWAVFLTALTALMALFGPDAISPLLLGGAAAGTLALALLAGPRPARTDAAGSPLPPVTFAFGLSLVVGGTEVGAWMLAIGLGLLVLSAGALLAERRTG